MRCIVSVATGTHYIRNLERLQAQITNEWSIVWKGSLPPRSPKHTECPYGFKIYAIEEAVRRGAKTILWMDSSAVVLKPLDPLWDLIERQGYWFSRNYDWNNGQFTSDEALAIMRMQRVEAFHVPQVTAACFGLDMGNPDARTFLNCWKALAALGAFKGDRGNVTGHVADPTKYQGHRNDQSCASYVAYRLGMKLTDPPDWWAEQGYPQIEKTVLTLVR